MTCESRSFLHAGSVPPSLIDASQASRSSSSWHARAQDVRRKQATLHARHGLTSRLACIADACSTWRSSIWSARRVLVAETGRIRRPQAAQSIKQAQVLPSAKRKQAPQPCGTATTFSGSISKVRPAAGSLQMRRRWASGVAPCYAQSQGVTSEAHRIANTRLGR